MLFTPELTRPAGPRSGSSESSPTAALLRQRRQPAQTVRQAVGRRIIRIGGRLAAEPSLDVGPVPLRAGPTPHTRRSNR